MKKNKLFPLLATLDKKELFAFSKYIKQQHQNEKVALPILYYIRKFYPTFEDEKKLSLPYLHKKVFGDRKYSRKKILNAYSDLYLWLKTFLLLEHLQSNQFDAQMLWLNVLQERGLKKPHAQYSEKLVSLVATLPKNNSTFYTKNMLTNFTFYTHQVQGEVPPNVRAFQNHSIALDLFYWINKLKLACEMANLNNLFSVDFGFEVIPELIKNKTFYDVESHALLSLYYKIFQLLSEHQTQKYFEIEKLLNEKRLAISTEEMHIIYSYLHNYAAKQIRQGNEAFWKKMHQLNKLGLAYKIFTKKGVMSSTQFNNIVNIACKVKDFTWLTIFIKEQNQYLNENIRTAAVQIAEANILFEKNNFKKALSVLSLVKTRDLRQLIRLKAFTTRCLFEIMDNEDAIFDYCIAFESFLQRNRKPKKDIVEATLNFVRISKKIIQKKIKEEKLLLEINQTTPIYFKSWLLEKAAFYTSL